MKEKMKQGLLWFDNDSKRSLEDKIAQAVARYVQKFGHEPNTCYVNPQMIGEGEDARISKQVRVVPAHNILPHHFWIGVTRLE
jgi:hypothetical protein